MEKLSQDELRTLHFNFTAWRDKCCNGRAQMSVQKFHAECGLDPHPAA
ncbi:hypothetical protein [Pseudomonas sp. AN3A02]|nr:hypothetical protein [Pseudomonas sp. AN3A02]NIL19723.1 hypothetical protein [Pseudomonas sp. AN3A02]